jgi:hypothetical protein
MKLSEIEDLMRKATLELLGLPDDLTTKKRVRISWPAGGAPAWKINEDVAFIRVYEIDDPYNRQKVTTYRNNDAVSVIQNESYTNVIAVDWILYGPNSFDDADTMRNGLTRNETLRNNNMHLIYNRPAPVRSPELFNGQWWERTNLTAYFNLLVSHEYTVPAISAAQVILKTEKGDVEIANITA